MKKAESASSANDIQRRFEEKMAAYNIPQKKKIPTPGRLAIVLAVLILLAGCVFLLKYFSGVQPADKEETTADKQTIIALDKILYDIEKSFSAGTVSYEDAVKKLEECSQNEDVSEKDIRKTSDYLEAMNSCKLAFTEGEKLKADKKYAEAAAEYKKVRYNEDCNYKAAKKAITECMDLCRAEAVEKADKLVSEGDHENALAVISKALEFLTDDEVLTAKAAEIEELRGGQEDTTSAEQTTAQEQTSASGQQTSQSGQQTSQTGQTVSSQPEIRSVRTVSGSPFIPPSDGDTGLYTPAKAADSDKTTCWSVTTDVDGGAGARIKFDLGTLSKVSGIKLVNGCGADAEHLANYGQICAFTLIFSDGSTKAFTASFNDGSSEEYEVFTFPSPVNTSSVTLMVNSGYIGLSETRNVCLSEFEVF